MKTVKVDIVLTNTIDVLDWLHTRGIVLFYKDNPKLNDKAFLQPKRVIDAIYAILNKEILEKEGQFSIKDLKKTSEIDPTTAIEIMLQMEMIFSVPNAENQYIAPQYLPEKHALQDLYEIASEEIQQLSYSVKLPLLLSPSVAAIDFALWKKSRYRLQSLFLETWYFSKGSFVFAEFDKSKVAFSLFL